MHRLFLTILAGTTTLAVLVGSPTNAQHGYGDRVIGHTSPIPDVDRPTPTRTNEYDGLKPGLGREETYFSFSPCLKTGWIRRQQLTLDQWVVEVEKMADQCGIGPLEDDEMLTITNYLATNYGPQR